MANDEKKPDKPAIDAQDWAAAVDEWGVGLEVQGGKGPAPAAAAADDDEPVISIEADDEKTPVPGEPEETPVAVDEVLAEEDDPLKGLFDDIFAPDGKGQALGALLGSERPPQPVSSPGKGPLDLGDFDPQREPSSPEVSISIEAEPEDGPPEMVVEAPESAQVVEAEDIEEEVADLGTAAPAGPAVVAQPADEADDDYADIDISVEKPKSGPIVSQESPARDALTPRVTLPDPAAPSRAVTQREAITPRVTLPTAAAVARETPRREDLTPRVVLPVPAAAVPEPVPARAPDSPAPETTASDLDSDVLEFSIGVAEPSAPAVVRPRLEDKPTPKALLPDEIPAPVLDLGAAPTADVDAAHGDDPAWEVGILDGEQAICSDAAQAARLAYRAGRLLERSGDLDGAVRRFERSLDADPRFVPALAALRRTAIARGRLDQAVDLLEREIEQTPEKERPALNLLRADLLAAAGRWDAAQALFSTLAEGKNPAVRPLTGLLDTSIAVGDRERARDMVRLLVGKLHDNKLRAALRAESGRQEEAAGADDKALHEYRGALTLDGTSLASAFGLYRLALRGKSRAELITAQRRLGDLLGGEMKAAATRRVAALELLGGRSAAAADDLASAGDVGSLMLRARAEELAGRGATAASTYEQIAVLEEDGPSRAEILLHLGEIHEKLGGLPDAAHAYERALAAAPEDLRIRRALERISRARGDNERLAELARAEGQQTGSLQARLRAARLLTDLGRLDEAAAELTAIDGEHQAVVFPRLYDVLLRAGRLADLGRLLVGRADAEEDAASAVHRERAVRLLATAGEVDAAVEQARKLRDTPVGLPAIWLEQRLLASRSSSPEGRLALAEALLAECEMGAEPPRLASLWTARAHLLDPADRAAVAECHDKALATVPAHPIAWIAARALAAGEPGEALALERARVEVAKDRPEAIFARLRLAVAQELSGDAAQAAQTYADALAAAKSTSAAVASIEDRLAAAALRAGDHQRFVTVGERLYGRITDGPFKAGLLVRMAGVVEGQLGDLGRALKLYGAAVEMRERGHLLLLSLASVSRKAGQYDLLEALLRKDAQGAPGVLQRVAALEQLAQLGRVRDDSSAVEQAHQDVLALDHSHHLSFRALERAFLAGRRWADLVPLYEQMGLTASDSAFAIAIFLDLARLRPLAGVPEGGAVANDLRMALFRDGRCRPALRRVLADARTRREAAAIAELAGRLAEMEERPSSAAIFATRAGEALEQTEQLDPALARYAAACEPAHHPVAMRSLTRLALRVGKPIEALPAARLVGATYLDPAARAEANLLAGLIAQERLRDPARAEEAYLDVLRDDPANLDAYRRLHGLKEQRGDWAGLGDLIERRISVDNGPMRLAALHLELAILCRDKIGDRARAKEHLRKVLGLDAAHAPALLALGDLHYGDEEWAPAAEILARRAKIAKKPEELKDIYFRLGLIFAVRVVHPKQALAAFARVLQIAPDDVPTLGHVSDLCIKERDWKGALGATSKLVDLEPETERKIERLHRLARICEEGFRDQRAALEVLKRAIELDGESLPAIRELARFYERQGDHTSARVHLDRSVQTMRGLLARNADDPRPYHSLFQVFNWRRCPDQALVVASLLSLMGDASPEEQAVLASNASRDFYPGTALADRNLDEALFRSEVPPGFRHLFRLLDEILQRAYRGDVKHLGVDRQEKLPRAGHAIRDVANRIAADLGVRDFEVYVTAAIPNVLTVELTEPLSLIIGNKLVTGGVHEHELRFFLGRCFKMVQSHMAVPMRLSGDELGTLVGAIVRQFVPDFVPKGFDELPIAQEAARLGKVIPKKMHQELLPFALECANPTLDLRSFPVALTHTANRAGALCAGSMSAALSALRRLGDEAQVRELLRFAVSDELAQVRRAMGVAVG